MSHFSAASRPRTETPSGSPHRLSSSSSSATTAHIQDSPTIPDRVAVDLNCAATPLSISITAPALAGAGAGAGAASTGNTGAGAASARATKKPAPSPLHASTAVSPPSSVSPNRTHFPSTIHDPAPGSGYPGGTFGHYPLSPPADNDEDDAGTFRAKISQRNNPHRGDLPSPVSPQSASSSTRLAPFPPNELHVARDTAVTTKPSLGLSASATLPAMATGGHPAAAIRADETLAGAPRNSPIDSAISAMSSKAHSQQGSQDAPAGTTDIANLVRAAGSPEAVIQYLLKEKQSQNQQNQQLWRLVDKQRAMILGLNKDLERSLKEKEKYRKKLKDVMAAHESSVPSKSSLPRLDIDQHKDMASDGPASPLLPDGDSAKESPIDVSMAPYPITPPSDAMTNGSPTKMAELLDPSHAMPKPSEHALDNFDHDEEERAAEEAKKAQAGPKELPFNSSLPPSRSLPSDPPRMPPPRPPPGGNDSPASAPSVNQGPSQFPPPSAPPPRKPPPAPLQLRPFVTADEDNDSESDYDELLEVSEIPIPEGRGRRQTREEDDRMREIIAMKEAAARSLSKKSKKGSQKGTPVAEEPESTWGMPPPPPPIVTAAAQQTMVNQNAMPASLAGVLNGDNSQQQPQRPPRPQHSQLTAPLMSPGLPASPRPVPGHNPTIHSPPLSPRAIPLTGGPLSPRAPRQPIPLPPNTPMYTPHPSDIINVTSPRSPVSPRGPPAGPPPTSPLPIPGNTVDRTTVFKGFVTEDHPELLLPPNALPSVAVKVSSSRMKPPRASMLSLTQLEEDPVFTLAILSRSSGGELWGVEKDIVSLSKLDQRMKQCPSFTAKTPDRSIFAGHSPAKLDARRVALDQYFDELLNTPLDLQTAFELCKYFSTNVLRPNLDDTSVSPDQGIGETNSQAKGPGGRPFKNGYLTKRGKNFGGWKARFFVLEGPTLKYYEAPGGAHLGSIKLQSAQIGKQSQHNTESGPSSNGNNGDEQEKQYRHAFLVMEPKKRDSSSYVKHVLCAESDQERDRWVETLLRWIDYRDPSDDERSAKKNRGTKEHKSNGSGQRNGSQDGLIGMSYDSARQGDAPDGAPPRRRGTGSPETPVQERTPTGTAAPSFNISGPKDPQLISDAAAWGGKAVTTLAPPGPTLEEKKQRKRSFFGFGPKTRSGSDDQDAGHGGNSHHPTSAQEASFRSGPVKQAFGAPLAEAVHWNPPTDVNVPLPAVVYRCIQYLDEKDAVLEEGIFRLSGSNLVIKALRERFNTEGDVNLITDETYYDIHAVASLLKLYLRELPSTILTHELHNQFVAVTEMTNQREKLGALAELATRLPQANATLLKYLLSFLLKIINNSDMNKMTVRNVGIVFSPTLNIPAPVFALLLQNYEPVFGIEPEEYELPTPVTDTPTGEYQRPNTADLLFQQQIRRPSTAGGSSTTESPNRQRLMEQIRQHPNHQGSSPTPPPLGGLRHPQNLAQQAPTTHVMSSSARPAYETGLMPPPNFDPTTMMQNHQQQPAAYEQQAPVEDGFSARAKRRESNMFMMGGNLNALNHQSSLNRLQE